jgi:hypothetical protein
MTDEEMAAASAPQGLTDDDVARASTAAPAAQSEQPGFFRRGIESIKSGASDVWNVVKPHPEKGAFPLPNASERREFERGLDSMVTLGYGAKIARRAEETNFGKAMNRALGAQADAPASMSMEQEAIDQAAAPGYRTAGGVAGLFTPGAASTIAKGAGKVVKPLVGAVGEGAAALAAKVGAVPLVGRVAAPLVKAAGGAAEGAIGYEAAAPAISAASADAEGHRGEAALAAATDPSGLILSGAAGAAPHTVGALARKGGEAVTKYVEGAPARAQEWLIKDLRGHYKGESTATAKKYLAADEADVAATLDRHPDLKDVLQEARHSDRKKLDAASKAVEAKIAEVNGPRTELYDRDVDGALGGGVRSGDFVTKLREAADEHRSGGTPGGHKMAKYLEARADELEGSREWGGETRRNLDPKAADDVKTLETVRKNIKDPAKVKEIDDQIAAIQRTGKPTTQYDPNKMVPARTVRAFVSDVQNAAFDGLGGLADTRAATQSRVIAGDAAKILDGYLDQAAAKAPDAVAKIRDINTQHSALKNIERVIDQRLGKATENASGASGHAAHGLASMARQHGGALTGAAALAATGHYVPALAVAAAAAAPEVKRFADTHAARLAKSPKYAAAVDRMARAARKASSLADFTRDAAAAGFPIADAHQIYRAAHPDKPRDTVAEGRQ